MAPYTQGTTDMRRYELGPNYNIKEINYILKKSKLVMGIGFIQSI